MSFGAVRSTLRLLWPLALSSLFVSGSSVATEQLWGFKGTLSSYTAGPGLVELGDAPVGTIIRGQVLFDDAATDADPSTTVGQYAYLTVGMAFEGVSDLHIGVMGTGNLFIRNDDPLGGGNFRDEIRVNQSSAFDFPLLGLQVADFQFRLNSDGPSPTVLASDALPASPPALSGFTTEQLLTILGYVDMTDATEFDVDITDFGPVGFADLPLIPDSVTTSGGMVVWTFSTLGVSVCVSGCWIDPPAAAGFTYTMTNSALFTGIVDFPSGFASDFDVSVGGSSLGTFGPGDSVDFTGFPGGGVAEFVVSGIVPAAGVNSAAAFPLQIAFDSAGAEFTMTSMPLAGVPLFGWPGLVSLGTLLSVAGAGALRRRAHRG